MQVRDEDVGASHQVARDVGPSSTAKVERDRLLAARRQNPAVVVRAVRQRPELRQVAVGIADLRVLDVHDIGAEVAEDRTCRRPEYERREFDDAHAHRADICRSSGFLHEGHRDSECREKPLGFPSFESVVIAAACN